MLDPSCLRSRLLSLGLLTAVAACGHPRPSAEESARGAQEFIDAIAYEKGVVDSNLAGVLKESAARGPVNPSSEPGATNPMVHQFGMQLVDGRGEPLRLAGVNLGGAFLWEGWIWGGDLQLLRMPRNSESSIRQGLADLLGAPAASSFTTAIYDRYVTAADFAAIASMGFNVVRVPLNYRLFDTPGGFALVDRLLEWAEASRVYVVLDLHSAPGGQSKYFVADPGPQLLWESADLQRRTVALWRTIAERYASRTIIAGYDLLNEPDPPSGAALVNFYGEIIKAIREVDRQHLVLLEGTNFAKDFSMFAGPLDPNLAYSFHMYTWFGEDPQKLVAGFAEAARRAKVPMWCGEFGENQAPLVRASVDAIDLPASAAAGWAFWTWKKASGGKYPALVGIPTSPAWSAVIQWISAP